ncbi:MAG: sigma-70 family RNA polymerase sigma factor [Deltaproteobacteria bacterium]|nr:sigma-70 family RNA polymerase sigma factor [Deltaproteobacteria bacterium]
MSEASSPLSAVIDRYERPLLLYAARIVGDLERARDVVQESFLRLIRERPAREEALLRAWLYTVCRNLALDELRKERTVRNVKASGALERREADPSPRELLEERETTSALLEVLSTLPESQQEVIRLRFQAGLSYREISEITKHSISNVGYLLHVAIKALRLRLTERDALGAGGQR